jgi:hypothetical protein
MEFVVRCSPQYPANLVAELCREVLEGSKELRLMLCREKFAGNKRGTSVIAACGESVTLLCTHDAARQLQKL